MMAIGRPGAAGLTTKAVTRRCHMDPWRELLATDRQQALEFFVVGLQELCEPTVDRAELCYNASVLAHYALVSTQSHTVGPPPRI